jgi:hypothetical protein
MGPVQVQHLLNPELDAHIGFQIYLLSYILNKYMSRKCARASKSTSNAKARA